MKQYYFTCAAAIGGKLLADTYFVENRNKAFLLFEKKYGSKPSFIDGPFYRKLDKSKQQISFTNIKLGNKSVKAIYNDKEVKAILLKEPENYAFLIYLNNNNSNNKTSTIVHISELKVINE